MVDVKKAYLGTILFFGWLAGVYCIYVFWSLHFDWPLLLFADLKEYCQNIVDQHFFYGAVATILFVGSHFYAFGKYWHRRLNHKSCNNNLDEVLENIRRCRNKAMVGYAEKIGIKISYDKIEISPHLLRQCSIKSLADLVASLLHLACCVIESNETKTEEQLFASLADQLLDEYQPDDIKVFIKQDEYQSADIKDFIKQVANEKRYLGDALDKAIDRRYLERQIEKIQDQIAEWAQSKSSEVDLEKNIKNEIDYCQFLLRGGSVIHRFFSDLFVRIKTIQFIPGFLLTK